MHFTPEQEQEIIEQNMPKIYRAVDNFTARCSSSFAYIPYADYVQEVTIAFLKYIRRCDKEEDVAKFPWFDAMGAMRNLILDSQPLSCHRNTHKFSEIIHGMPQTMSLDALSASTGLEIDGMSKHWVDDKETQMDFDTFMEEQSEHTRRVASMRIYGMTLQEIGDQCGVTRCAVKKRLDKLSDAYKIFTEGAKNA